MRRRLVAPVMVARAVAAVCTAVVLCAVLAACDSDKKPVAGSSAHPTPTGSPPSKSTTPTASPSRTEPLLTGAGLSPGEQPPSLPAAAEQGTATGAVAFASYFVQALDWSLATTDPFLIKQFSAPSCKPCSQYVDRLTSLSRSGGHLQGARISLSAIGLTTGSLVHADFVVNVTLDQQPVVVVQPDSAPSTAASAASDVVNRLYLSWSNDRWQVVEIGLPS